MKAFEKFLGRIVRGFLFSMAMLCLVLWGVYYLLRGYEGNRSSFYMTLIFGVFLAVVALVGLTGHFLYTVVGYDRAKKRLLRIPGFSEERFQREVARGPQIKNVLLCSDAICYCDGSRVRTIPIREIVWAYQEQPKSKTLLCMRIYTVDGDEHQVQIVPRRNAGTAEAVSRYVLRLIARKSKGVPIGYDENLERLWKRNPNELSMRAQGREIVDSGLLEQEYLQNDYYTKDVQ